MDFIAQPPQWLLDLAPEGLRELLEAGGWWGLLGFAALVVVLLLWACGSKLHGWLFGRKVPLPPENLHVDLATIPDPAPSTGDRRLTVEGVPVRVRLVVMAPTGHETTIQPDVVAGLLEKVIPGLGELAKVDAPLIQVWTPQLSYQGFAHIFHRNTPTPEGEGRQSPWVLVAGRARIGPHQVMLGLGLKAIKPTTVGRLTLEAHQWPQVLRVRVRD